MHSGTSDEKHLYTRCISVKKDLCEKAYGSLYDAKYSSIFCSGMNAIMITMQADAINQRNPRF